MKYVLALFTSSAMAQTLTTAVPPSTPTPVWVWVMLVLAVVIVIAVVAVKHKDPSTAALLAGTVAADGAKIVAALDAVATRLEVAVGKSLARPPVTTSAPGPTPVVSVPTPMPAMVKSEPTAIGKNGRPGSFIYAATGNPTVDVPAIIKAYYS